MKKKLTNPVKKSKAIQINVDKSEFADRCQESELAQIDLLLSMSQTIAPVILDTDLGSVALVGLIQIEKRIVSIETYLSSNPPNQISNIDRLEKLKKQHLEYYNKILKVMKDKFLPEFEETRIRWKLPRFNPDGSHDALQN